MKEDEVISHESFGSISFNRTVGGGQRFYGSELSQDHFITMQVKTAETHRNLSGDHHFGCNRLIEIRMTSGQFAELITSLNTGSGVPCTLEYINGKKVEDLPKIENKKEFTHRKFGDRMKDFAKKIKENKDEAKNILKKKTLSKADQDILSKNLDFIEREIVLNIPFFAKQFQEATDEIVYEAKLEVENSILHKVSMLGLEALHEQNKLLTK